MKSSPVDHHKSLLAALKRAGLKVDDIRKINEKTIITVVPPVFNDNQQSSELKSEREV